MGKIGEFFKSVFGICETRELDPNLWQYEGGIARIQVDKIAELKQPDGAVYLKGKGLKFPVLIVRTKDNGYLAFRNRCTHMGHRKVDPVPGKSTLRCCSVNHSTYDYAGKRLSGPAKDDLVTHDVNVENGELTVRIST